MKSFRNYLFLFIVLSLAVCCAQKSQEGEVYTGEIKPFLLFHVETKKQDDGFNSPRDFAVDETGNIYVFSYMNNIIRKYDQEGNLILTFGGTGEQPGKFSHLMAIHIFDQFLYAVDSAATVIFDLEGHFLEKRLYPQEAVCDFPRMDKDVGIVGEHNLADELKKALILRSASGREKARLTEYDLQDFFPELRYGEEFFIQDQFARSFDYDFDGKGNVIWTNSDEFKIYKFTEGKSDILISDVFDPLPFPQEKNREMKKKHAEVRKRFPALHMFVPEYYPMLLHLFVAPNEDIWVYLRSVQKTGFLVFSSEGKQKGFLLVQADFDMADVRCRIYGDRLYLLSKVNSLPKIYTSPLPEEINH